MEDKAKIANQDTNFRAPARHLVHYEAKSTIQKRYDCPAFSQEQADPFTVCYGGPSLSLSAETIFS